MPTVATEVERRRIIKGWAFMALPKEENDAIKAFLRSGLKDDLPESWHRSFDFWIARRTHHAKRRRK